MSGHPFDDRYRVIILDKTRWAVWYSSSAVHLDQLLTLERTAHETFDFRAQAFSVRAEHAERVVDMMNGTGGT